VYKLPDAERAFDKDTPFDDGAEVVVTRTLLLDVE